MLEGWRWFGPSDAISLKEIRQAGVTDVVTALHHVRCGDLWTKEEIQKRADEVKAAGMRWSVVESVPVHESIKKRQGDFQKYIDVYKQSLRNLANCGIKTVCYNFMPILDWTRTHLARIMPDGSSVLHCDADGIAAFDLFILKRPGAETDYSAEEKQKAKVLFDGLDDTGKKTLADSILLGLPGTVDDLSLEEFQAALNTYQGIDDAKLRRNLYNFLNELALLCDELGIRMAVHPDDPPRPIFGLPRVMSKPADVEQMFAEVPSENIGLTFCTGSFGGSPENDVAEMFERFAHRIHFAHLRNVTYVNEHSFHESNHLSGSVDMARVMAALLKEEDRRQLAGIADWGIVVRPDHGKLMEIDKNRTCYAGYSYGGRLVGLAELRGLELGLRKADRPFLGRVAVITGAAGVLCSTMSRCLLRAGCKVALLDLRIEAAQAFKEKLAAEGFTETMAVQANVLDKASLEAAREDVLAKWGKIDILLNGAGGNHPSGTCAAEQITHDTPLAETFFGLDMKGFEFTQNLNFIGSLLPSQVFGVAMMKNGGSIINISSMAAFQPLTKVAAYSAAKAAIDNFNRWLATHLAPVNIRVNALAPGFFLTEQNRFLQLEADGVTLTPRGKKVIAKTPMRKYGDPSDLCGALKFLLSDEASFVTGVTLCVDGGFMAYAGV